MTESERAALSGHNAQQLDLLDPAMAGLVVSLVDEVERRGTYVRLSDPVPNGNEVRYEVVEGDAELVTRAARSLGFKSWSDMRLEAFGG